VGEAVRRRLRRAVDDGELAADTDIPGVASYFETVLQGLSMQARNGASRQRLHRIIDCAMSAWDVMCGPPAPAKLTASRARGAHGRA
jgi:hypothetical protein